MNGSCNNLEFKFDELIENFFDLIRNGQVEIYNEFSLQHEVGIFLRNCISNRKIQFERNVSHFGWEKKEFYKKEIDLCVLGDSYPDCAIELKYPRNGRHPEEMFSFCKDIAFVEQLIQAGFSSGYFLVVTEDPLFYSGGTSGIYGLFRGGRSITGKIQKPTGEKDTHVSVLGSYKADWKPVKDKMVYLSLIHI